MPNIHLSHTAPINPPSSTPTLTLPQIWTGLQLKIRHAQLFVPVIESCHVVSDDADTGVVTREVVFKKGRGPKDRAREVVRSYWPSWVDFEQEDHTHIRNIVSDGPGGGLEALYMTYTFEFSRPDLEGAGQEAIEKETLRMKEMSQMAVESTIKTIREMVVDGRIAEDGTAKEF